MGYTTSDEWDAHYARQDLPPSRRRRATPARRTRPGPDGGGLALDVGCDLGELARHLAENSYEVDAIDYAPAALTHAKPKSVNRAASSPST
ncbi:class I SAM-dependent methyltransferase [Streptomyces sp. 2A115]|uniref:class I SAM-dependent methyltransferase n=1 Tax=Streptomyces sp. 2A115 TaxID=3457439 RepID=UPI003FD2CDBF